MVSEAKKPLVASMAFLAIYLTIILAITTYLIVGGIKEVKVEKDSDTSANPLPSKPESKPSSRPKREPGSGFEKFKKAGKKVMSANALKATKKYVELHNVIKDGLYLEPKPQQFLDRFQNEFYARIYSAEPKEPKSDTRATEDKFPDSPYRFFKLKNTFGLHGSAGYFCYYNATKTADFFTKTLNFKDFDSFIKTEKLKLVFDDIVRISGQFCQIKIVVEETVKEDDYKVFTDENVKVLADFLIAEKKPWDDKQLEKLNMPSGFGFFLGLEPRQSSPSPAPVIEAFHRKLEIKKKRIEVIRNIFREKELKALYYGDPAFVFTPNNFDSLQAYAETLESAGYECFDNEHFNFDGLDITAHYAAKTKDVLKDLVVKSDLIIDTLRDKTLTSRAESTTNIDFFNFVKTKDFCILFVYEYSAVFESFFKTKEIETDLVRDYTFHRPGLLGSTFVYRVNIKKFENFEDQIGKLAYKFSILCDGYKSPKVFNEYPSGEYDVRVAGIVLKPEAEAIAKLLTDNFNDEKQLKAEWIKICEKRADLAADFIIIKK